MRLLKLEGAKNKMIKDIMKDPLFLAQKSTDATKADQQVVVDLLDLIWIIVLEWQQI